ncbi:MAG: dephospho-CoA kinase [Ruminococcus sp.]|nr:dephospho-CoA kinase [Ruminococcus sp.]
MIIGLTGQSGAGKTLISEALAKEEGFAVIDCDKVAKAVTQDGSPCNKELKKVFPSVIDKDHHLDRQALAKIVFSDKEKLKQLESIIYPYITTQILDEISAYSANGYRYIILDAPTLFEAGVDKLCDRIISVIAKRDVRLDRIRQRDKISDELINKRFDSQRDDEFFIKNSDYIINNDLSVKDALSQLGVLIKNLREDVNG